MSQLRKIKKNKTNKPTPHVGNPRYWAAFNEGREYEREVAIHYFITKLEQLKDVPGVGEKTFNNIMEFVNKEWGTE